MQFDKIDLKDIKVGDYIRYTANGAPSAGTVASIAPLTFETRDTVWAVGATGAVFTRLNLDDYKEVAWNDIKLGSTIMYMSGDLIKPGGLVTKRYKFYNTAMLEIKVGPNVFQASAVKMQKIWLRRSEIVWTLTPWRNVKAGHYVKYWQTDKYLFGRLAVINTHEYVLDGSRISVARTANVWVRGKVNTLVPPTSLKVEVKANDLPPTSLTTSYVMVESKAPFVGTMPSQITLATKADAKLLRYIGVDGTLRFIWQHHSGVCVGVTNLHIFKIENDTAIIVPLSDIVKTTHKQNGYFRWDDIVFQLKTRTATISVYDDASVKFILQNLR